MAARKPDRPMMCRAVRLRVFAGSCTPVVQLSSAGTSIEVARCGAWVSLADPELLLGRDDDAAVVHWQGGGGRVEDCLMGRIGVDERVVRG